jgi:hypothetical protein
MQRTLVLRTIFAVICFAAGVATAEQDPGPDTVVITDGTDSGKKPSRFTHRDHVERFKDCAICHHGKTSDGKKERFAPNNPKASLQKCAQCHKPGPDGVSLAGKAPGVSPIQRAGHAQCMGCHKDAVSSKTPPVMLMGCPTCHTTP